MRIHILVNKNIFIICSCLLVSIIIITFIDFVVSTTVDSQQQHQSLLPVNITATNNRNSNQIINNNNNNSTHINGGKQNNNKFKNKPTDELTIIIRKRVDSIFRGIHVLWKKWKQLVINIWKKKKNVSDNKNNKKNNNNNDNNGMGQVVRIMKYDTAGNEKNAKTALQLAGHAFNWFRLDDGVMGGQSETYIDQLLLNNNNNHNNGTPNTSLHFHGIINTDGGGFTSIRSKIPNGLFAAVTETTNNTNNNATTTTATGFVIRIKGDGKTYKFFMTDGSRGGPMSRQPSWQIDIPTIKDNNNNTDANNNTDTNNNWQEVEIQFDQLIPSFAGGGSGKQSIEQLKQKYSFHPTQMQEMGFMLSLKLANGNPNPVETFGYGIFPFSLQVQSIELLSKRTSSTSATRTAETE